MMKRITSFIALLVFSFAFQAQAAVTLVATSTASAGGPNNTATTASVNTSGANFYVMAVTSFGQAGATSTANAAVSDSQGDTWHFAANWGDPSTQTLIGLWYAYNTTGVASMTFSAQETNGYIGMTLMAMSGILGTADPFDVATGTSPATSANIINSGAVTPSQDNELCVSSLGTVSTGNATTSAPFVVPYSAYRPYVASVNMGSALSYYTQTTAAVASSTWGFDVTNQIGTDIACFKSTPAVVATGSGFSIPSGTFRLGKGTISIK